MRLRRYRYIIPTAFLLFTCLEEDPVRKESVVVNTGDVNDISAAGVRLSGTIAYKNLGEIIDHGFVWGTQRKLSLDSSFFARLGTPEQAEFSAAVNSTLAAKTTYYCRSFVKTKEKTVYGNLVKFLSLGSEGPVITAFAPLQGSPGDTLKISGRNFSQRNGANLVAFEGVAATVAESTDTLLKVVVPFNLTKVSNKIRVSILDRVSESGGYFNLSAPRILNVPNSTFMLCDTVVIRGEGFMAFGDLPKVRLNSIEASTIDASPTQIRFTFQRLMPGTINLTIAGKLFTVTSPVQLTQVQPEITSIDPPTYIPGDTITISGKNWPSCKPLTVTMHNTYTYLGNLQPVHKTDNQLRFVVPAQTCITTAKIAVVSANLFSFTTDKTLQYKLPKILAVEPSHGKVNDIVVIRGENLDDRAYDAVNFLTRISSSKTEYRGKVRDLLQNSPAVDVQVTNCGGSTTAVKGFTFDAPEITSFSPQTITSWDDIITIEGKNFSPADNKVTFNDAAISYSLPASATGDKILLRASFIIGNSLVSKKASGKIKITTRTGQSVTSTGDLTINYEGIWTGMEKFPGVGRTHAVCFTINGKGYLGMGRRGAVAYYKDWWEFDPVTNIWTAKSDFPGQPNYQLYSGASANGKGYVGLGELLKNWWQYDPATDQWERKADFPGPEKQSSFIFELNNKIYIGGGYGNMTPAHKDFWEYDPVTDQWTEKAAIPQEATAQTLAFGHKGKGYLYMVKNGLPLELEYNPATDEWTTRQVTTSILNLDWRVYKFDEYVIVHGSYSLTSTQQYFYKIIPGANSFTRLTYYSSNRVSPSGFVLGGKGYTGMGYEKNNSTNYLLDLWAFDPEKLMKY